MSPKVPRMVVVERRARQGWYSYTCNEFPGLMVMSNDDQMAFSDVSTSLRMLVYLEYGLKCTIEPMETLAEFLQRVRSRVSDLSEHIQKTAGELPEDLVFDLCLVIRENPNE